MFGWKFIALVLFLTLAATGADTLQAHGGRTAGEAPPKESIVLTQLLVELGKDYDGYFTIEGGWKEGESVNAMEALRVQRSSGRKGLRQELERLRKAMPNFTYEVNKADPHIIHIMDARLVGQKAYGLESVVGSLDFTGTVFDLVSAIAKQGILVSSRGSFLNEQPDYRTTVRVKAEGLKVRDVLSNFLPPGRKGRILWIARTRLGQREVSYVHYP